MQEYLQIFEYEKTTKVRTLNINGEIWFYGLDVCEALDIKNPSDAYSRLDADDLGTTEGVDSLSRKIKVTIVSESGFYALVFQSRKPEAKRFKTWVTREVLPQIRQTGGYGMAKGLPAFVRRFNDNWDRIDRGHFSVINEVFIRLYGRLEQVGYVLPDRGAGGREIRPDVSVGLTFSTWLKKHHPARCNDHKKHFHLLPGGMQVEARQYPNDMLHLYIQFVDEIWLRQYAEAYLAERDPKALQFLPKLLGPAATSKKIS
ncbi:MAG: BRO family protein [Opitutaceae bacterium]|nr:BRO family protein [Opitutaceae bacterium]